MRGTSSMTFLGLLVGLLGVSHGQNICPPAAVLLPCRCEFTPNSQYVISCTDIPEIVNFKEVFDRASEFINEGAIFDSLYVSDISNAEIGEGAFGQLKFKSVSIILNSNLEWISPTALAASGNVTTSLYLDRNRLRSDGPRGADIFDLVRSFEKLERVDLQINRFSSIPPYAFRNLPSLERINLNGPIGWVATNISHIGSRAFATGSANLSYIFLSHNSIPSEGLPEDAFDGISSSAFVDLRNNGMSFLDQRSYQALLDQAYNVYIGIEECSSFECYPLRVFDCDERADWMCNREEAYRPKLRDQFACKSGFRDVWDYCAAGRKENGSSQTI